jgi:hypothetical protein
MVQDMLNSLVTLTYFNINMDEYGPSVDELFLKNDDVHSREKIRRG